jgi:hypothetical protein
MSLPIYKSTPDTNELSLGLAVLLQDRFTGIAQLFGKSSVVLAGVARPPYQKTTESTYLFFGVRPGTYTVQVRSDVATPYYLDVDIPVSLPMPNPRWPAFPDMTLADPSIPLSDPSQPAVYRAQRDLAALRPTTGYPFPAGATLVRGTVTFGGAPLARARVRTVVTGQSTPDPLEDYQTGVDGQFVLALVRPSGLKETITVRASHMVHPDVDVTVEVGRGTTAAVDIAL